MTQFKSSTVVKTEMKIPGKLLIYREYGFLCFMSLASMYTHNNVLSEQL